MDIKHELHDIRLNKIGNLLFRNMSETPLLNHALIFQNRPCILINRRENQARRNQLIYSLLHIHHGQVQFGCDNLHMQTLVALELGLQQVKYSACHRRHSRKPFTLCPVVISPSHSSINTTGTTGPSPGTTPTRRPPSKEKMNSSRLQQMRMQLINIPNGPHTMRTDEALIRKRTHAPKHAHVAIHLDLVLPRLARPLPIVRFHCVRGRGRVDPLLDLDLARAVIDLVRDVCGLRADVAHLADEGDAGDVGAVDLVVGFWVGLRGVQGLFDCDWAEGGVVEVALAFFNVSTELYYLYCWFDFMDLPFLLRLDSRSSPQA